MKRYIWNILLTIDQGINTILGGDPDETISSRAAKRRKEGARWACILCKFLNIFDKNHCNENIEDDEGKDASIK